MSKQSEAFGKLADALETAAAAARELEATGTVAEAKSADSADDGVARSGAKPKGKGAAATAEVAAKPAKGAKAKAAAITFEILKAKLTELVNTKGKEAAKEILSEFGAPKLVDLSEDDYTEAHSKAVAALAADEEDEAADSDDDMFGE